MEQLMTSQQKKSFSIFASALACVIFIIFNLIFLQLYSLVPNSTIRGNIVIPASVITNQSVYKPKSIEEEAFYASKNINNIKIEEGIESIGVKAFAGTGIKSIFLPKSVTSISAETFDDSPFYACSKDLVIYLEANEVSEEFGKFWNYRGEEQPLRVVYGSSWENYLAETNQTDNDFISTNDSQVGYILNEDKTATVIRGKEGFSKLNKAVYYLASFLIEFLFGVVSLVVAKALKINLITASGMNKKINGKIILDAGLISLACIIFFSGVTQLFMNILGILGYSPRGISISIPNFSTYLIYVLISCVAPAIFEELLFRGTILSGLKEKGEKIALYGSAAIFMLMHGSPDQTVHQFIIGLVIGYIFIKTGNLWIGVLVHFFNNFIAITETYVLQILLTETAVKDIVDSEVTTTISGNMIFLQLLFDIILAAIMFALGYKLVKYLIKSVISEDERLNKKPDPALESQSTIMVDGTPTETTFSINGESSNTEKDIDSEAKRDFENDELFVEIQQNHSPKEETKQSSKWVTILFALSGAYLVIEWIIALISGF